MYICSIIHTLIEQLVQLTKFLYTYIDTYIHTYVSVYYICKLTEDKPTVKLHTYQVYLVGEREYF